MAHSYLQNLFAERGCKLLTTEDEYIALKANRKIPKVEYIASCGHKHTVHTNVFISRNSGIKCPACVAKDIGERKEGDNSRTEEGGSIHLALEDKCREYITKLLENNFEVVKNKDGCLSDFCVRKKGSTSDEWLQIQLKSTLKQHYKVYGFHIDREYPDCAIICMCWEEKRIWVFNWNEINGQKKLSIGHKTSKYDSYAVKGTPDLIKALERCMDANKLYKLETINIPISVMMKKEHEYATLRETKLPFLNFALPSRQNLVYNFMIGDLRVQEKVAAAMKGKKSFNTRLSKHNKKVLCPYAKGNCDLYWVHAPDKDTFWVIPESVLLKKGYLASDDTVGKTNLHLTSSNFEDYKFTYSKLDKELLLKTIYTK